MKRPISTLLVCLLAVFHLFILTAIADNHVGEELRQQMELEKEAVRFNSETRAHFKLPKMFNFDRYKSAFKKHYQSAVEEMIRMKLYMGRAYQAFLSAVKYKYCKSSYYLVVNSRSDWTAQDLEASKNKMASFETFEATGKIKIIELDDKQKGQSDSGDIGDDLLVSPQDLDTELKRIDEHASKPGYDILNQEVKRLQLTRGRQKRNAKGLTSDVRDDFDMSDVFERKRTSKANSLGKNVNIKSNNPMYEQPELASEMSLSELELQNDFRRLYFKDIRFGKKLHYYDHLPIKSKYKSKSVLRYMTDTVTSFLSWMAPSKSEASADKSGEAQQTEENELPDIVWVDHRNSNCVSPVQDQGRCGSCYAFATLAFMEWAFCMETGAPVKFSEQYVIDCGLRLEGLNGCNGGLIHILGLYINNFGLEMAHNYPYKAREEQCPYDEDAPISSMGFMRVDFMVVTKIPLTLIEEHLSNSPMVINIATSGDFNWYGGGVYDGKNCGSVGTHSVLMIGHGREDGEEYWLIRNSHSVDFGEQGYMKLNKNSNCIIPDSGYIYGDLRNGKVKIYPERNKKITKPIKQVEQRIIA